MKLLIVDDSIAMRLRIRMAIEKLGGWSITEAKDGSEALEIMFQEDPPSVVLLDWIMKEVDGIETCKKLRVEASVSSDFSLSPYIIMLTAKNDPTDIVEGLDAGANDYLLKPWDFSILGAKLRVAQRSVLEQQELLDSINQLERLSRRNDLAHRVIAKSYSPSKTQTLTEDNSEESSNNQKFCMEKSLTETIAKLQLGTPTISTWDGMASEQLCFVVWSSAYLSNQESALDLLLFATQKSVEAIQSKIGDKEETNQIVLEDTFAEVAEIVAVSIREQLIQSGEKTIQIGQPVIITETKSEISSSIPSHTNHYCVETEDFKLYASIAVSSSPSVMTAVVDLKGGEIAAHDFFSPWKENLLVLKKGTVINQYFIKKLMGFVSDEEDNLSLNVYQPTKVGRLALSQKQNSLN